jgi:hypothetical protein
VKQETGKCKELYQELHDLLFGTCTEVGSDRAGRLWKFTLVLFNGKEKSVMALLIKILEHPDILVKQQIISNTALLKEIRVLVQELSFQSTIMSMQDFHGDNNSTLTGGKVTGEKVGGNKDSRIHYHQGDVSKR